MRPKAIGVVIRNTARPGACGVHMSGGTSDSELPVIFAAICLR